MLLHLQEVKKITQISKCSFRFRISQVQNFRKVDLLELLQLKMKTHEEPCNDIL